MEFSQDQQRKFEIFHPFAFRKIKEMEGSNTKFVHYCSADTALNIINSEEVWLRNAAVMNDFMEIEHGRTCLNYVWHSEEGKRFKKIVNSNFPGITDKLEEYINGWSPAFQNDTFITCLSEHDPKTEDDLGSLSMWRAYGGTAGVAIVLNPDVFLKPSDALPAYTSPVAYLSGKGFEQEFAKITDNIENNIEYLRKCGWDDMFNHLFNALKFAILCTKHRGFSEEREWRIIYQPSLIRSNRIEQSVKSIRGMPQIVHSIPFKNYPDEGFTGAELSELVYLVIIGPTEFPQQLRLAMISLLEGAGIQDAAAKVVCSTIPLRQ